MAIENVTRIIEKEANRFLKKRLAIEGLKLYSYSDDFNFHTEIRKRHILGGWLSAPIARTFRDSKEVLVLKPEWFSKICAVYSDLSAFYPDQKQQVDCDR